jgi:hypothetical protein
MKLLPSFGIGNFDVFQFSFTVVVDRNNKCQLPVCPINMSSVPVSLLGKMLVLLQGDRIFFSIEN